MSALDTFLNAHRDHGFQSRQSGSGHVGQCPVHDDRTPSMSINYEGGKVLICCQVGCANREIVQAIGLKLSDLYDEDTKRPGRPQKYQVVDEYEYQDERGAVLFVKQRVEPGRDGRAKDFKIYRPMPGGQKSWGLKGVDRRPLFRLPRIVEANEQGATIYIVEGEKDVKAAERAGAVATCNFDGAATAGQRTKWKPEYGDTLKGAHVVIVQDNDEAGRAHAAAVYSDLHGKAASVRIVQGLVEDEHSDLSDHLAAGHTLDDLVEIPAPSLGRAASAPSAGAKRQAPPDASRPIDELRAQFFEALNKYMHLADDYGYIKFSLAVGVSSELDGDPLWGMIVGPPSGGKTEGIKIQDDVAEEHVDDITGPALLSWTPGRNPRPTGILTRVGSRAFVTISDFSTILATSDRGGRDTLFALLRRAYDGHVVREVGTAPEPLEWIGRLTLLAAVTPAIDNYSSHTDALGPRWLYYRMPKTDSEHKKNTVRKRRRIAGLEQMQAEAQKYATALVYAARRQVRNVALDDEAYDELEDAAMLTCLGRAAVPRHAYGRREIDGIPVVEEPARITGQIVALTKALIALGETPQEAVRLARKCALDTVPEARLALLKELAHGAQQTVSQVSRLTGLHRHVARRALEDMEVVGLTMCLSNDDDEESEDAGFPTQCPWALGEEADLVLDVITAYWRDENATGASSLARNVGSITPSPPINRATGAEKEFSGGIDGGATHTSCQAEPQVSPPRPLAAVPAEPVSATDDDMWGAPLQEPDDDYAYGDAS